MGSEKIISGVNILEERLVPEISRSEFIASAIASGLCVFVLIFLFCFCAFIVPRMKQTEQGNGGLKGKLKHAAVLTFTGCVCIVFILSSLLFLAQKVKEYRTLHSEYVVTLSDTVSFNEFNEKYAVTGHDGDTYTVRIRADNKES